MNINSFYISELEHSILSVWAYFSCFTFPNCLFPCSVMKTPWFLYSAVQVFFLPSNPINLSSDWTSMLLDFGLNPAQWLVENISWISIELKMYTVLWKYSFLRKYQFSNFHNLSFVVRYVTSHYLHNNGYAVEITIDDSWTISAQTQQRT